MQLLKNKDTREDKIFFEVLIYIYRIIYFTVLIFIVINALGV